MATRNARPTVSVIMPVHNGEPYLSASVESILGQSLRSLELVVIDDASTDDTWSLLTAFRGRDSRVVLGRHTTRKGTADGLNRGLTLARGAYIARQDADDLSDPQRLRRQVAFLESHPAVGLVSCWPQFIDPQGLPLPTDISRYPLRDGDIHGRLPDYNCLCIGVLIRRPLLDRVGPFRQDRVPSEDYDMWLRLSEVTALACLPEALYDYRQHDAAASTVHRARQMWNKAQALQDALARRQIDPVPAEWRTLLARDFVRVVYLAAASGLDPLALEAVERSRTWEPRLFDEGDVVEQVVQRYLSRYQPADPQTLVHHLFADLFPRTAHMRRAERRLQLLQRRRLSLAGRKPRRQVLTELWQGLLSQPSWILNPGVWSTTARRLAGVSAGRKSG